MINIVIGASCVGKSTYINKNKDTNDIVIDMFEFQKDFSGNINNIQSIFYRFASSVEFVCREHSKTCNNIWIECVISNIQRFKMLLNAIEIATNEKINIIYLRADETTFKGLLSNRIKDYGCKCDDIDKKVDILFSEQYNIRDLICSSCFERYNVILLISKYFYDKKCLDFFE